MLLKRQNRNDLSKGANIIYKHFKRFGLTMHIGTDGTHKDSKTEAVHFNAPDDDNQMTDLSPVRIGNNGYITYAPSFTHLGSKIDSTLNNTIDVENRIIFKNKYLSLTTKKMLYLAIPVNLLLWGCETWTLKAADYRKLQVFHTKSIRKILGIGMTEVQESRITNDTILRKFDNINPIEDIVHNRQLRWIGKIPNMSEKRLPRKMLGCWIYSSRKTGRPFTTIRHSYLNALKSINVIKEDDKQGRFNEWFHIAKDTKRWKKKRFELINKIATA